ncbi:MAG: polymer-forming cytoskeletal protein [Myxococcota bacterium]|nr:polymer-forming cytoskeletal protein [Myxococcota bacterium]
MSPTPGPRPDESFPWTIGPNAAFDGLLSFRGGARLGGRLSGEVVGEGWLWIAAGARIRARIEADLVLVEGEVEGEIVARELVDIRPTARIRATVHTPSLSIDDGASLDGPVSMPAIAGTEPPSEP